MWAALDITGTRQKYKRFTTASRVRRRDGEASTQKYISAFTSEGSDITVVQQLDEIFNTQVTCLRKRSPFVGMILSLLIRNISFFLLASA